MCLLADSGELPGVVSAKEAVGRVDGAGVGAGWELRAGDGQLRAAEGGTGGASRSVLEVCRHQGV